MGIKPITISETAIYNYDKDLVFKPKTFNDYENDYQKLKIFRLKEMKKLRKDHIFQ